MSPETLVRLTAFCGVLCLTSLAEAVFVRRPRALPRARRWPANMGVVAAGQLVGALLTPLSPIALAAALETRGLGLFQLLALPAWIETLLTLLLLDLAIYGQHAAMHRVRFLWRLHRMHHADLDLDTTTALRFHPGEILVSLWYKLLLILVLGPSPMTVLLFEILLNGCAMFNHANLRLPPEADRWLRLVLVTPDMHLVHHSTDMREANKNFGFNFPWWDRLFKTYQERPKDGIADMRVGLNIFRDPKFSRLDWLLAIPFLKGR